MTGPEVHDVVQLWRALNVGAQMMLVGMATYVLYVYVPLAVRGRDPLPQHIALVALSYVLFVVTSGGTQLERLLQGAPFSWRLVVVPVATLLGLVALEILLRDLQRRRRPAPPEPTGPLP
jgi:hypothetical protein